MVGQRDKADEIDLAGSQDDRRKAPRQAPWYTMCSSPGEGTRHSFLAVIVCGLSMMCNSPVVVDLEGGWTECGFGAVAMQRGKEVGMIAEIEDMAQRCLEVGHLDTHV